MREGHTIPPAARQRSMVLDGVEEQLMHEPTVETKNRKPMRPNPVAPWELRIDPLRVYYDRCVSVVRQLTYEDRRQLGWAPRVSTEHRMEMALRYLAEQRAAA